MLIQDSPIRISRILHISDRISQVEKKYIQTHQLETLGPKTRPYFSTQTPYLSIYGPTHNGLFATAISLYDLPLDRDFVDLGSGFGGICFTAGLYFQRAVGIELDQCIFQQALQLGAELNYEGNVSFRNEDFLNTDWNEFGVIFIYEPFWEGLKKAIEAKVARLPKGTIIFPALHPLDKELLMSPDRFRKLPAKTHQVNLPQRLEAFKRT